MKRKVLLTLLLCAGMFTQVFAQAITGTVTDGNDGLPLVGVNVMETGTTNGTISDIDGNFSLTPQGENPTIRFSFIGYEVQDVVVGDQTTLNIVLNSDMAALDEVVVVGYGTQKKSHLTGSVAKLKNDRLADIPVSRADDAISGKMAGVLVTNVNAGPGEDPIINVRGASSLSSNSSPLLVIDGVQVDGSLFGSIDMNDVESIEVLKDAASAAIYGSQAADGVIMITTKKGKAGTTNFNFNAYRGVKSSVFTHWNRPTPDEWLGGNFMQKEYIDALDTEGTNWFEEMTPGGDIQSYALSASGGTDKVTYNISGSFLEDEGILLTDNFKKYNARANVNIKPNERFEIGLSIAPSATEKREFAPDYSRAIRAQAWLPVYHTEESLQFVDPEDAPNLVPGDYAWESHYEKYPSAESDERIRTSGDANPMQYVVERNYTTEVLSLITSGYLSVNLFEGLNIKTQLSSTFISAEDNDRVGVLGDKSASKASTSMAYDRDNTWLSETYLTYNKSFGLHDVNALLGVSAQKVNEKSGEVGADGYENDYIETISSANNPTEYSTYEQTITRNAVFGRISYAYDSKYLLSATLRRDGSSTFGKDEPYAYFPSASIGWRVNRESFLSDFEDLSELKLRVSYGSSGKDATTNPYSALDLYDPTGVVFNGSSVSTSYIPSQIGNPILKWQESSELNFGLDLGFMSNRVLLGMDFYKKSTIDMLLEKEVSAVTGFESALVNQGEIENTGIDIELTSTNIAKPNFTWKTNVVLSTYDTEIIDLAGAEQLVFKTDEKRSPEHIAQIGGEPSAFWGIEMDKEIPGTDYEYYEYPIGNTNRMVFGVDQDGDGEITEEDKVVLGSPNPSLTWSLNNSFNFKAFDLSFSFIGKHGASVINADPDYYTFGWFGNPTVDADNPLYTLRNTSSYMVQDVSYIAFRDLNLGYTLPKDLTSQVGVESLRIYFAASNIAYWMLKDEYTGYNPDGNTGNPTYGTAENPLMQGYQNGARPIAKTFSVGVNLNF